MSSSAVCHGKLSWDIGLNSHSKEWRREGGVVNQQLLDCRTRKLEPVGQSIVNLTTFDKYMLTTYIQIQYIQRILMFFQ